MKTEENRLFIKFFLLSQTISASIRETNRAITGRGRVECESFSSDSGEASVLDAPSGDAVALCRLFECIFGFPIR